jgi:protein TonB
VEPRHPYDLQRTGVSGWVRLEFIVDSSGRALDIWVVDSSRPEFDQPAIQALAKWKFRPGKKGGKTVNTKKVQQVITFRLNENQ